MGGEKSTNFRDFNMELGSPPHGRGKVIAAGHISHGPGITPAWAGKRKRQPSISFDRQDHPRMGGEKPLLGSLVLLALGSPPHGRGKGIIYFAHEFLERITPAWAGKSNKNVQSTKDHKDHPRMGGEKNIVRKASFDPEGSPPHGRGKEPICINIFWRFGITPAWAGKSCRSVDAVIIEQDHPRMGGEKTKKIP